MSLLVSLPPSLFLPLVASSSKPDDPVSRFGELVLSLPGRLWHLAARWWPWLLLAALVAGVLAVLARMLHRWLWRRAVAAGSFVWVVPPRSVSAEPGLVWRLLASLARRARYGFRLAKPPLAAEIHHRDGRLLLGLWVPARIPLPAVEAEVALVWSGATITPGEPQVLDRGGWAVAARVLTAASDTRMLVDETSVTHRPRSPDADLLGAVLAALREPHGPAVLQVLVRPAPARRVARLRAVALDGREPKRRSVAGLAADGLLALVLGASRLLLDLVTELLTTGRSTSSTGSSYTGRHRAEPVDALTRHRMGEARAKLQAGPLLLAAIRVAVARPNHGWAQADAAHVADGYAAVSDVLRPARLRDARHVAWRWAGRRLAARHPGRVGRAAAPAGRAGPVRLHHRRAAPPLPGRRRRGRAGTRHRHRAGLDLLRLDHPTHRRKP